MLKRLILVLTAILSLAVTAFATGEASRDSSGLEWGNVVSVNGQVQLMTQDQAIEYCEARQSRVPTKLEFEGLVEFLSERSGVYNPRVSGSQDFFQGLSRHVFWTSSFESFSPPTPYFFDGRRGQVVKTNTFESLYAVVCTTGN